MSPSKRQLSIGAVGLVAVAGMAGGVYLATDDSSHGSPAARSEEPAFSAVVYGSPTCGCCKNYEEYLRKHDVEVESEVTDAMASVKEDHSVPAGAESCHTMLIGDYVVEGHVPMEAIDKLLAEQPDIDGIAVAGMPTNSPGMGEPDDEPLEVVSIDDGSVAPFMTL